MARRLNEWLERIQQRHPGTIELGLERCQAVWTRMGQPRPARRIVTVAGTNGKGSTVAGIVAGLAQLERTVGSYTSPHLIRFNERVRINGTEATDEALIAGFEAVEAAAGDNRLTYFEFVTLAAFFTLSRQSLDYAVLEIGLGGRLDAVNIIDADLAVITPIGMDHMEYLGHDRESIAAEKAGIMRAGTKVVCSDRDLPFALEQRAANLGASLITIGSDFEVTRARQAERPGAWRYFFADLSCDLDVAMNGSHQADNLSAALTAVLLLEAGAAESLEAVAQSIAGCRVSGRLQWLNDRPAVLVDVGHNPAAAGIIGAFLAEKDYGSCRAVLAMLADKDAEGVVTALDRHVTKWYCAGLTGDRGQTGERLAGRVRRANPRGEIESFSSVSMALDYALEDAAVHDLVLVFGSFQTAAQAIMHFESGN